MINFTIMKQKQILALGLIIISLMACNKEKNYSKKLIKGEVWNVKNITVNDSSLNVFGQWSVIQDVDIYDNVPQVLWLEGDGNTYFNWQFQNKGENFQLSYVHKCFECDSSSLSAIDYVCYDLTGNYTVEEHKRKQMKFTSNQTIKYSGKTVVIDIEKKY